MDPADQPRSTIRAPLSARCSRKRWKKSIPSDSLENDQSIDHWRLVDLLGTYHSHNSNSCEGSAHVRRTRRADRPILIPGRQRDEVIIIYRDPASRKGNSVSPRRITAEQQWVQALSSMRLCKRGELVDTHCLIKSLAYLVFALMNRHLDRGFLLVSPL